MKLAYCDCFSGISGDMFLAALLDAGLPLDELIGQLKRLPLPDEWQLSVEPVMKGPLRASLLHVEIHEHPHTHHRHPADILAMIEAAGYSERVQRTSAAIFERLAQAEARVHGVTPEEVHFHEVGAVDSILDIVGAAIGLEYLGIERLYASALPLGSGQVTTQHGPLPLPAPATLELLRSASAPVTASPARVELVTPTGAAILAALASFEQPAMRLQQVGVGAGQRDMPWPNVLRVMIGEGGESAPARLCLIETNIDDLSGEVFGYVMEKLFAAGALDVFFTPIQMKKNRPATMLSVIARRAQEPELAQIILRETSSFGVRVQPIERYEADRELREVDTRFGAVTVKLKRLGGHAVQAAPEYEVCARLAAQAGVGLMDVYRAALQAAGDLLG